MRFMLTFAPMNGKDEIRKRRLYYEGLKQAIATPVKNESISFVDELIQDDEVEQDFKDTLRFWKEVNGPLDSAITFIHNNRFLVEEKEYIIKEDSDAVFMKPEEIFNVLKNLLSATVMEFLSVLEMPSTEKTKLLDYVEHGDKDGFVSMLEQAQCDLTPLAKLCSCCWDALSTGAEMEGDDFSFYLDSIAGHQPQEGDADDGKIVEAVKQWQPSVEVLDDDDSDEALRRYFSDYRHFLETDLAVRLHYYWDWYDDFTLKERNLINPILDNPMAKDLIDRIWEEYQNPKPQPSEPFALPADFFDWQHKSNAPKEFFYMDDTLKKRGVDTLVAFIDWLADKGFIADDNAVKALLAYRLTGRCRPEGEELPVIEWHGKNGKSYELIYLVRYLSDRADYKKMRRFFTSPEWVKDRDSSYANSADSEFRKQMSEFYPEVCRFVV